MATKRATEVRKGNVLVIDGDLWQVVDQNHHTPGNLRSIINIKLKNLASGQTRAERHGSGDVFEIAFLEQRNCQYLYRDQTTRDYVFMDLETYEQYQLDDELVGEAMRFVVEEQEVPVTFHSGRALGVVLPPSVSLEITEADPAIKGNTVSNVFKRAVCSTGLEIKVPMHIAPGESVKVSTETGEFQGRAKD